MKATLDATSNTPKPRERPKAVADIHFRKVTYLPSTNSDYLDAELERYWTQAHVETHQDPNQSVSAVFVQLLQRSASLYKNAAFSLEKEFRLLVPSFHLDLSVVRGRPTKSSLAPYLVLDVPSVSGAVVRRLATEADSEAGTRTWDAIERIVIGPTIDKQLTRRAVETYVSSRSLQANVDLTTVPFRDW